MPIIDWTGKGTGQNHARISILERTRCFVGEIFTRFNLCSLRTVSRRRLFSTLNPKYGVFSPLTGMDLSAPAVFLTKVDMTWCKCLTIFPSFFYRCSFITTNQSIRLLGVFTLTEQHGGMKLGSRKRLDLILMSDGFFLSLSCSFLGFLTSQSHRVGLRGYNLGYRWVFIFMLCLSYVVCLIVLLIDTIASVPDPPLLLYLFVFFFFSPEILSSLTFACRFVSSCF